MSEALAAKRLDGRFQPRPYDLGRGVILSRLPYGQNHSVLLGLEFSPVSLCDQA